MNPPVDRSSQSSSPSGNQPPDSSRPPTQPETTTTAPMATEPVPVSPERQQPIPPPSHPRQYRAIGLIRGQYLPSQEQLTRGALLTAEGTAIDTVLLGRLISLVKNHIDLAQPHLWVVYPRTRQEDDHLHVQVVGIWEPETLKETPSTAEDELTTSADQESGYFSIRGEVIYASTEKELVIVKIRQSAKKEGEKPKYFKLKLKGTLPDKPVGHFWDLQAQLTGNILNIEEGTDLGELARRKKLNSQKKGKKPYGRKERRDSSSYSRPIIKDKKTGDSDAPKQKESPSKPIKRRQD